MLRSLATIENASECAHSSTSVTTYHPIPSCMYNRKYVRLQVSARLAAAHRRRIIFIRHRDARCDARLRQCVLTPGRLKPAYTKCTYKEYVYVNNINIHINSRLILFKQTTYECGEQANDKDMQMRVKLNKLRIARRPIGLVVIISSASWSRARGAQCSSFCFCCSWPSSRRAFTRARVSV